MAAPTPTQTEPQRPAQPQAPQPVLEKTPWQNQQPMQFIPIAAGQHHQPLLQPPGGDDEERPVSRNWYLTKLILGSLSLVASIVIWALCIVILARYTGTGDSSYSDSFQIIFESAFALSAVRKATESVKHIYISC